MIAQCDPSRNPTPAAAAKTEVLWSKVLGRRVFVLEKDGVSARISIFALDVSAKPGAEGGAPSVVSGTVTLASSHALARPSLGDSLACVEGNSSPAEQMEACSAACLASTGGIFSVVWRSSRGAVWTKVVMSASGVREEFTRPISTPRLIVEGGAGGPEGADGAVPALCNGHMPDPKSTKESKSRRGNNDMMTTLSGEAAIDRQHLPMLANADGGRLLVHSGGPSPRLAVWDATYGVLLDDHEAPEIAASAESPAKGHATSIVVSGDGGHLAVAAGGKVVVCPLPVKEGGSLASLLRRKHPAALVPERSDGTGALTVFRIHSSPCFPAVDLTGNPSAAAGVLLRKTGVLAPEEWEEAVVSPFRKEESAVVKALEDATRRKDSGAFERVLREHAQQRARDEEGQFCEGSTTTVITTAASAAQTAEGAGKHGRDSVGIEKNRGSTHAASLRWEHGRSNRRRAWSCSAGVLSSAVELCILNPEANLWNALGLLVRSGGVSAREHRGLVTAVVKDGPQELLEEVRNAARWPPSVNTVFVSALFAMATVACASICALRDLVRSICGYPAPGVNLHHFECVARIVLDYRTTSSVFSRLHCTYRTPKSPTKLSMKRLPAPLPRSSHSTPCLIFPPPPLRHRALSFHLKHTQIMLHVPDLPEGDAVRILRYFLSQAAAQTRKARSVWKRKVLPGGRAGKKGDDAGGGAPHTPACGEGTRARRRRTRELQRDRKGTLPPLPKVKSRPPRRKKGIEKRGVNGGAVGDRASNVKMLKRRSTEGDEGKDVGGKVEEERGKGGDDSEADREDGVKKAKIEKEKGDDGAAGMEDRIKKKKKLLGIATSETTTTVTTTNETTLHEKSKMNSLVIVADTTAPAAPSKHKDISSPQKNVKNNGVVVGLPNGSLSNGHHASDDDSGSSDTGNISEECDEEEALPKRQKGHGVENAMEAAPAAPVASAVGKAKWEVAPARPDGAVEKKKSHGVSEVAAVRAERGVRVALTLPHNEAFLRSALSALSHGEVIVVLQVKGHLVVLVLLLCVSLWCTQGLTCLCHAFPWGVGRGGGSRQGKFVEICSSVFDFIVVVVNLKLIQ